MMTSIFAILLLFILFYSPPILPFNSVVLAGLVSYIYILFHFKSFLHVFRGKRLFSWLAYVLMLIYLLILILINRETMTGLSFLIYIVLFSFSTITVFIMIVKKRNYSIENILRMFLITGLIQALISVLALAFPAFQNLLVNRIVSLGYSDVWLQLTDFRLFGYSDALTYGTPVLQSFLGIISIFMALEYNKKYFYYTPFLIFSSIINARTSFVVLAIGAIILIFTFSNYFKDHIFKFLLFSIFLYLVVTLFINIFSKFFPEILNWLILGINDFIGLFSGDVDEGYFSYLLDKNNYPLPNNLIFGEGRRTFENFSTATDIGYINDLWLGGIVYSLFIYGITAYNSIIIYKNKSDKFYSFFSFFYILTQIFINFKGVAFGITGLNHLFLIVLFLSTLLRKNAEV